MNCATLLVLLALLISLSPHAGFASAGTQGAAFLDIPVGARPAALGSAYTALADDAYAPTWNPSGLGFLNSTQLSGQHLSYLDTLHYEHASFVIPIFRGSCSNPNECARTGLGASVQYLGSGDVDSVDAAGGSLGSFSNFYASYNLSAGHSFNKRFSVGLTGKMIHAKLADTSATAYAADLGTMVRPNSKLTLAAKVTNLGSQLKFESEGDDLPLAFHLGAAYQPSGRWMFTTEGIVPKAGLASVRAGGEWRPIQALALRAGYRTDVVKELSDLSGFSTGLGLGLWGSELAYAWLPYGDLGDTHYVSFTMKIADHSSEGRNLIHYQKIKTHRVARSTNDIEPEYQVLMDLLAETDELALGANAQQDRQNQ